jgi:hypothetical protein
VVKDSTSNISYKKNSISRRLTIGAGMYSSPKGLSSKNLHK